MHRYLSVLLLLSGLALSVLVPGGPIENRDFSHISPVILTVFNSYLTALGIGSFMLAYFCFQRQRWAYKVALLAGIGYLWVYIVDLARLFPTSPTPMPAALEILEIAGVLLALPMVVIAAKLSMSKPCSPVDVRNEMSHSSTFSRVILLGSLLLIVSIGIILFATLSAMGKV